MTVETLLLILQITSFAGIAALLLLLRRYMPAYVGEKGKNLATKEDIAEITRQIEGVKAAYAHDLEEVRAAIGSRLGIHQFRYQREYELLSQLAEKVVELRDAATTLRPESDYVRAEESEADRKKRRLALELIRSRGQFPKGGYDVHDGGTRQPATPATVHGGVSSPGGPTGAR